jgi:hypothetical protein
METSKYLKLSSCGTALMPGTLKICEVRMNPCSYTRRTLQDKAARKGNLECSRFSHQPLRLFDNALW